MAMANRTRRWGHRSEYRPWMLDVSLSPSSPTRKETPSDSSRKRTKPPRSSTRPSQIRPTFRRVPAYRHPFNGGQLLVRSVISAVRFAICNSTLLISRTVAFFSISIHHQTFIAVVPIMKKKKPEAHMIRSLVASALKN